MDSRWLLLTGRLRSITEGPGLRGEGGISGGGVQGSNIIGGSDRIGAEPTGDVHTPEKFSATIYDALGVSRNATWTDVDGRPYNIYMANPIEGIYA